MRPLSQSTQLQARKDAQGKDEMTIESNEYSKSGSDAQAAGVEKAAFDPKSTRPEEEHDTAGREAGVSEELQIMSTRQSRLAVQT